MLAPLFCVVFCVLSVSAICFSLNAKVPGAGADVGSLDEATGLSSLNKTSVSSGIWVILVGLWEDGAIVIITGTADFA